MSTKLTKEGRVFIPKFIRDLFDWKHNDVLDMDFDKKKQTVTFKKVQ